MKIIVVTSSGAVPKEVFYIRRFLDMGAWRVHIRKPDWTAGMCESLVKSIGSGYYDRIVLHDFFPLAAKYSLAGVHLNRRNPEVPINFQGTVSCSCHTLEEAKKEKEVRDYVFISPVFDSISKAGYHAAFGKRRLDEVSSAGLFDKNVFALGGVSPKNYGQLRDWNFRGAALLGAVWENPASVDESFFCR